MRIVENFDDPSSETVPRVRVTVALVDHDGSQHAELRIDDILALRMRTESLGTLIGMLEAIRRRASVNVSR